ncbi:MAG: hypothetical protein ABR978_05570, partial [Dehalococcoidia bacterium]
GLLFMPGEWSPDSRELVYSTYSPRPSSDWPGYLEQDPASERWYLLRVDGSPPEPVAGIEAVHERWYGQRNVQLRCSGEISHSTYCSDQKGSEQPVDIYLNGSFIGSGYYVNVVGFIDR